MGKIQFYKIGEKKVTILQVCNTKFAYKVKKRWKNHPPHFPVKGNSEPGDHKLVQVSNLIAWHA